jgi:general secretion pathway protein H
VGNDEPRHVSEKVDLKLFTAEAEVSSERNGSIRFYPDGSSTGGRVTVSSGERKYQVDVDWITGRVSIGE